MTAILSSISIRTSTIRFHSPTPASAAWKKTRTDSCGFRRFLLLSVAMICVTVVSWISQERGNTRKTIPNSLSVPTTRYGYGIIRTVAAGLFTRTASSHHRHIRRNREIFRPIVYSSFWRAPKEKYGLAQTRDC